MMRQSGNFRYAERSGAQIVKLPYKGGMSMRVVLPPKQMPFPKFCAELTSIVGTSWTRAMSEPDGHIRLPRFAPLRDDRKPPLRLCHL
jgi:serine protease inhibitor